MSDGTVVTWGSDVSGGDSSSVASELVDIKSISASDGAFAALRADGKVFPWGAQ